MSSLMKSKVLPLRLLLHLPKTPKGPTPLQAPAVLPLPLPMPLPQAPALLSLQQGHAVLPQPKAPSELPLLQAPRQQALAPAPPPPPRAGPVGLSLLLLPRPPAGFALQAVAYQQTRSEAPGPARWPLQQGTARGKCQSDSTAYLN